MANSRKLKSADPIEQAAATLLSPLPAGSSILIGLSGGVDSVVLLHILSLLAPLHQWRLSAMHVHHGISPNAGAWAEFCTGLCARYEIPLEVRHVDIAPLRAHGIEAAARKLRHAAFAATDCDFVALAHHADDQAETLLLQLLRGSGVKGAAAMAALSGAHPARVRPLLHCTRQQIVDYAAARGLNWIEDESNADDSYPRNFLRHRVLPQLEMRFPAYRETLGRSAQHFAEAGGLLDDLARLDGAAALSDGTLAVAALQALSPPRAKNLLRYFLHQSAAPMPQAVQLADMLEQLCGARDDAAVCVVFGGAVWQVRRYRGRVYVLRAPGEYDRRFCVIWQGEAELPWPPLQGRIRFERREGQGISLAKLQGEPLTLRLRSGGETLRPAANAATRTLKNLLQEHRVPPWQRDRLPLLYCGEQLVCVPGVAVAAAYLAEAGEPSVSPSLDITQGLF